ncbi:HAMP domain-containing protein, partial [Stenotrophomonas maltophilia]
IFGALASLLLGRLISARLAAIGTTANAIIAGDYSRRVPVDSLGGTFAEQARTFNRMLDRIEALMDNLRQVSSDIAHD